MLVKLQVPTMAPSAPPACRTKRAARPPWNSSSAPARRSRQKDSVKKAGVAGGDQRSRCPSKFSRRKRAIASCMPGRARRTVSRAVANSGSAAKLTLRCEHPPLLRPAVHRGALEAALRELVPAADHEGDDRVGVGVHVPVGRQGAGADGEPRALPEARLEAVDQLVH